MAIGAIEAMIDNELFIDLDESGIIDKETEPWIPVIGVDGNGTIERETDLWCIGCFFA